MAKSLAQRWASLTEFYVLDVNMRVKFGLQQPHSWRQPDAHFGTFGYRSVSELAQ